MVNNISIITGSQYFLGSKGKATCSGGDVITNSGTCREACSALDISFKEQDIKSGYPCYRDSRGKCYKNGLNGDGASMVCENDSEIIFIIFFDISLS